MAARPREPGGGQECDRFAWLWIFTGGGLAHSIIQQMPNGEMMPGIVVGVDGSGHSQRALEWAINEAAVRHAPLTIVTVHQLVAGFSGRGVEYPGDSDQAAKAGQVAQQDADKILEGMGESRPASVTVDSRSGFPVEELLDASKEADMIVLGSRGAGGFSRLLMGSVSSQVTHHAHCPVVIVPHEDRHAHH
jgi:nucleotide-binding universal stress UspA family protein